MASGEIPVVRICEVRSVDDDQGGDRIKVRMVQSDYTKSDDELDYAFPLLPKMLHVKPKVGEWVIVINAVANNGDSQRYYIGPVISQETHMEDERNKDQALSMFRGNPLTPENNPNNDISKAYGALSNPFDIDIIGRRGSEMQLKPNEARLKAGVRLANPTNRRDISFNSKNPSYLKLKYHEDASGKLGGKNIGDDGYKSTATIVADKIFLLGNTGSGGNGKDDTFDTRNVKLPSKGGINGKDGSDDLITDKELNRALKDAHQVPFGDALVKYLKSLTMALRTHTHAYSMLPATEDATMASLGMLENSLIDREEMLSDNVRIN